MGLLKLLTFSIYRLCEHPEYTKPLLGEIEAMLKLPSKDHYKSLQLMESFLREASRHDPMDSCTLQQLVVASTPSQQRPDQCTSIRPA